MNIHLPAILMFTRGTRFWHIPISADERDQIKPRVKVHGQWPPHSPRRQLELNSSGVVHRSVSPEMTSWPADTSCKLWTFLWGLAHKDTNHPAHPTRNFCHFWIIIAFYPSYPQIICCSWISLCWRNWFISVFFLVALPDSPGVWVLISGQPVARLRVTSISPRRNCSPLASGFGMLNSSPPKKDRSDSPGTNSGVFPTVDGVL